jgi:hypothetical protein
LARWPLHPFQPRSRQTRYIRKSLLWPLRQTLELLFSEIPSTSTSLRRILAVTTSTSSSSWSYCDDKPVLLVEVKDDSWIERAELRYRADDQMRSRYALMLEACPFPRLRGLSLLGTSARVYCGGTSLQQVRLPSLHPLMTRAFFRQTF